MKLFHCLTIICSYCKKTIGVKDGQGVSGISHGICRSCLSTTTQNIRKMMAQRKAEALELRLEKSCEH